MTGRPGSRRSACLRRLTGASLIVLVTLLPAMVAGIGLERPAAPGEWARLEAAATGPRPGPRSLVADGFLLATAPIPAATSGDGAAAAHWLGTARIAQVLGVLALSWLGYLAIALVGGRARALLTVAWLAVLPPVLEAGHVLRPETAACMFGLLGLLLLQCVPFVQRPAGRRKGRWLATLSLVGTAAGAFGAAVATVPSAGILLLLPGCASMLAAGQLALRLWRAMRQRSVAVLPLRACTARLWPWVAASMAALWATAVAMQLAVEAPDQFVASATVGGLLPAAGIARYPLLAIALLGAVRLVLWTGQRLGRRGRLGADLLLLLWAAVLLLQRWLRPADDDALAAALPCALLLAEGSVQATLLLAAARQRGT